MAYKHHPSGTQLALDHPSDISGSPLLEGLDEFARQTFFALAEKADPILARKLAERGIARTSELPVSEAGELLRSSIMEAATLHFPECDIEGLRRATAAVFDVRFQRAMSAVRTSLEGNRRAFDIAQGYDFAILLSGIGVPVMPLDKKSLRPLGPSANSVSEAVKVFASAKSAFVGYCTARLPFYVLVTDCLNSMLRKLKGDPHLRQARQAVERTPYDWTPVNRSFQHAVLLVPRLPEDRFATLMLEDPRPDEGSVLFLAGWVEDDAVCGAPEDGRFGVPLQLVDLILKNPSLPASLTPATNRVSALLH